MWSLPVILKTDNYIDINQADNVHNNRCIIAGYLRLPIIFFNVSMNEINLVHELRETFSGKTGRQEAYTVMRSGGVTPQNAVILGTWIQATCPISRLINQVKQPLQIAA